MDSLHQTLTRRLRSTAAGLSLFAGLLGAAILAGWILEVESLIRFWPDFEPARPLTACALLLGAFSLLLFLKRLPVFGLMAARVAAGLVVLAGVVSLGESVFSRGAGINQFFYDLLVFGEVRELEALERGMAPTSAVGFVFLGAALLLVYSRAGKKYALSSLLCVPPLVLSVMVILGYIYGASGFYQVGFYEAMAVPTALGLAGLSIAIILARPDLKPASFFAVNSFSGYVSRRLIVAALVVPPVLSWWRLAGERAGLYGGEFGLALLTLSMMGVLTAVVLFMAGKLGAVEARLRRQTEINRTIIDVAPAALFLTDSGNRVTTANQEVASMFGWTQGDLTGHSLHGKIHGQRPDGRPFPEHECPLVSAAANGRPLRDHEDQFFAKDGRVVHVLCSSAPLVVGDPTAGSILVVQDITRRKRDEERLQLVVKRLETLANMIPQFCWSATPDGEVDYFNDRWYEYTGMPRDREPSRGWVDYLHPEDREAMGRRWKHSVTTGQPFEITYRYRRASDDTYRWFIGRAAPIWNDEGKIDRWFGTSTDIEDQRRQEERLEERVAERTAVAEGRAEQVRTLSIELTEAEQRERARVARVLHDDLQQTLVAARMQVERIRRENLSAEALATMESMISQAIATARSLSKELAPPVLFQHGLGAAMRWLGESAREQYGFEVEVDASETGPAEEEWLRVVLYEMVRELLLNAAKHSATQRIRLELKRGEDGIQIGVEDFGKGFSVEAMQREGSSEGSGLAFVRQRAALIGGRLTVESAPGEGARVRVSVPVRARFI